MFQATRMLFMYVETPLHAGTGRGLGTVDLPIQRERITGYPMVYATGLKGCLRAASDGKVVEGKLTKAEHLAIFGPETNEADKYAGALSTGDARILLFPVRSLAGVLNFVDAFRCGAGSCVRASLIEINERLLTMPSLLQTKVRLRLPEWLLFAHWPRCHPAAHRGLRRHHPAEGAKRARHPGAAAVNGGVPGTAVSAAGDR